MRFIRSHAAEVVLTVATGLLLFFLGFAVGMIFSLQFAIP